jgi:MerR family transcriptional regulator/heat shock protein HspR
MGKEYWTITEVVDIFEVEERFLRDLEEEEILCPQCFESRDKQFSRGDLEKLRLIKTLVEDMGVNLPGVEVILHMRQNMLDMRAQFDAILEELSRDLQETIRDRS